MQPSNEIPWTRIWQSRDGHVWHCLTESEFKTFALEQLAINWAAGREVQS